MADDILECREFKRLVRLLGEPIPHVLGYVLMIWHHAVRTDGQIIGDAVDVEAITGYAGQKAGFTTALVDCGFLDRRGQDGGEAFSAAAGWDYGTVWGALMPSRVAAMKPPSPYGVADANDYIGG